MALTPGTRVGAYEIVAAIGAGGMGEVYRARDPKLGRDVALKILPDVFASDHDRLARFQREARVLGALNHPHIAIIHGLEDSGGTHALVMELVEGPTLADRIAQGVFSTDEALAIARQIADALDAAHGQGIVHRDLKPANVKVRDDGTVKVLDFGLAKALDPSDAARDAADLPTITSPALTQQGIILGTAAYMSPEQARGKPVDKRADIWAFGCVVFEMVTGRRLFGGEDLTETIAAVVKDRPDLTGAPANLRPLLRKCLEKDPRRRLRDIGDVWDLLVEDGAASPATSSPPAGRSRLVWNAALVLAGAALGVLLWMVIATRDVPPAVMSQFVESMPEGRTISTGLAHPEQLPGVAISPDGRTVVYRAQERGQYRLFRRFLDQREATPVGEVAANAPFFSPDGQWIGFTAPSEAGRFDRSSTLKVVPVRGGASEVVVKGASSLFGAVWNADGTIIVGGAQGLRRVSRSGGEIVTLTQPSDGRLVWYPQMLPGNRALLHTVRAGDDGELFVFDLATRESKRLLPALAGQYISTGHLVFTAKAEPRDSYAIWAVPFDVNRLEIRGTPVVVVEDIRVIPSGPVPVAVADAGVLMYLPGRINAQRSPVWVDRAGREEPLGIDPGAWSNPRVSPDGNQIALVLRGKGSDVWIWDRSQRSLRQLTSDVGNNYLAAWFPDGKRLAFSYVVDGVTQVYWQAADGSGAPQPLMAKSPFNVHPNAFSRDGSLLYTILSRDIGILPRGGREAGRMLLQTPGAEINAAVSPDNRWLAFESDRTGRVEVYVRPFGNVTEAEWPVTSTGGCCPMWGDGELYYWTEDGDMVTIMAVPTLPGPSFRWTPPAVVARGMFARASWDTHFDVWGKRVLVLKSTAPPPRHEVVILQNWFEELKRLVPVR